MIRRLLEHFRYSAPSESEASETLEMDSDGEGEREGVEREDEEKEDGNEEVIVEAACRKRVGGAGYCADYIYIVHATPWYIWIISKRRVLFFDFCISAFWNDAINNAE